MSDSQEVSDHQQRAGQIFEISIRLGLVFLLLTWGFLFVAPFLHVIVWGVILAVTLFPVFQRVSTALGGRPRVAGVLFIVTAIALIIAPACICPPTRSPRLGA